MAWKRSDHTRWRETNPHPCGSLPERSEGYRRLNNSEEGETTDTYRPVNAVDKLVAIVALTLTALMVVIFVGSFIAAPICVGLGALGCDWVDTTTLINLRLAVLLSALSLIVAIPASFFIYECERLSAHLFGSILLLAVNISALFCIIAIFIS